MATPQLADYRPLMTPDAVVIYPNRGNLLLVAGGGAVFVALGLFLCFRSTSIGVRIAGLAVIVFFGFCLVYAVSRLLRRTPALIIHSSGMFDNASAYSAGFLSWDEISGVYVTTLKNNRLLAIKVKDVEGILSRQSGFKARLMKMNIGLTGSAVNIPASTLPISLEELIQKIQQKCPSIQVTA